MSNVDRLIFVFEEYVLINFMCWGVFLVRSDDTSYTFLKSRMMNSRSKEGGMGIGVTDDANDWSGNCMCFGKMTKK